MSVHSLNKITEQIIKEAEAEAKAILDEADRTCEGIREDWRRRTAEMQDAYEAKTAAEGEAIIARAKSARAMTSRNVSLQNDAAMLDDAYKRAQRELLTLPDDQYLNLLAGVLVYAVKAQYDEERRTAENGDEFEPVEKYEVLLGQDDLVKYKESLIQTALPALKKALPAEVIAKVVIAGDTLPVRGGLILRCGPVEVNCTIPVLMKQIREETESEVSRKLIR